MNSKMTYKDAGVDIEAGNEFVFALKKLVKPTYRPEVISNIGGFASQFALNFEKHKNPVLVSSTDGVGTKLLVACMMNKHDSIGIDLVAMCVNDIIVQGAEPLFMLDYISTGKIQQQVLLDIVTGIVAGCREAGCALVGGETAEMPSVYKEGEYDMAGFAVGVADKEKIIDGSSITVGDKIIGIASQGIHSNGLSLARKVFFDKLGAGPGDYVPEFGCTVGEELLKPTRIYAKTIINVLRDFQVHGIAHITGGGLSENVARILPNGCMATIHRNSWETPPVFTYLHAKGGIDEDEMLRTFNNGIGMVLIIAASDEEEVLLRLKGLNEDACVIGAIRARGRSDRTVEFTRP